MRRSVRRASSNRKSHVVDDPIAEVAVALPGRPKSDLDSLGWTSALRTHRPFLSYNELGSLLDEGPSKLYDALSSILGLEDLVDHAVDDAVPDDRTVVRLTCPSCATAIPAG